MDDSWKEGKIPEKCGFYSCLDILKESFIDNLNKSGYEESIEYFKETMGTLKLYFIFKQENPKPEKIQKILEDLEGSDNYKKYLERKVADEVMYLERSEIPWDFLNEALERHLGYIEQVSKILK